MSNLINLSDYKQQHQNSTTSRTTGSDIDLNESKQELFTETNEIVQVIFDHVTSMDLTLLFTNPSSKRLFEILSFVVNYKEQFISNIDNVTTEDIYLYIQNCLDLHFDIINMSYNNGLTLGLDLKPYLYNTPLKFPTK